MKLQFHPSTLKGKIQIPPSKSLMHRYIIASALANGESVIQNIIYSADIIATAKAMEALGAKVDADTDSAVIKGIAQKKMKTAVVDCNESGSTLRFLIPIAAALGIETVFTGQGKLPSRPITPYLEELTKHGIRFDYDHTMPFKIDGKLTSGEYRIAGNISSQFITGLLFALPLLQGDSVIKITGKLESKPYADMTVDVLSQFGIDIRYENNEYHILGGQEYRSGKYEVEGDYSQAAFFAVAAAVSGDIELKGLTPRTYQGDKEIIHIVEQCGARVQWSESSIRVSYGELVPFSVDVMDIPDLVPILAVLACFCDGQSTIYNAERLKIKESDRLQAISECLNTLGGKVTPYDDRLVIEGTKTLNGGEVDSCNDHRIAMAAAIAALFCTNDVALTRSESVRKSYPCFYKDYECLGGKYDVISME